MATDSHFELNMNEHLRISSIKREISSLTIEDLEVCFV
jgi:hypothetical protein